MTPEKIVAVVERYEKQFKKLKIPKLRMSPERTFGSLTQAELLAHAHYLCAGTKRYARDPEKLRRAGSHLTAIQMCLSFAGWFTLQDLMNHNRPSSEDLA